MTANKNLLSDELIEIYMSEALTEAKKGYHSNIETSEIPVGCVIADNHGNILARAHNTKEQSKHVTGHAEISALNIISDIRNDFRIPDLYVFVTLEPCPMCAGALAAARPAAVYFGTPNTTNGACGTVYNLLYPHVPVFGGIMSKEASKMITDFFSCTRAKSTSHIG